MSIRPRPLGKTGLVVSELSLGTWGLSGDGYGPVDAAVAEKTIGRALDMGFTLFDTADAYGAGTMEARLGRMLHGKAAVVVTKVGTNRTTDPPRKRFDPEALARSVRASLKRLGRERIDVLLLHNPSPDVLVLGEAVGALLENERGDNRALGGRGGGRGGGARGNRQGGRGDRDRLQPRSGVSSSPGGGTRWSPGSGSSRGQRCRTASSPGCGRRTASSPEGDHRADRWTKLELERRVQQLDAAPLPCPGRRAHDARRRRPLRPREPPRLERGPRAEVGGAAQAARARDGVRPALPFGRGSGGAPADAPRE